MKIRTSIFKIFIFTILFYAQASGQKIEKYTSTKDLEFRSVLNAKSTINIDNSFGVIDIRRWDKNEIYIKAHLKASGASQAQANEILNGTNVEFINADEKKIITKHQFDKKLMIEKGKKRQEDACDNQYSIETNLIIYIPDAYPINVSNSFGKTFFPDLFKSEVSIKDAYGLVATARLQNVKNISLSFSNATFKELYCKEWIQNDFSTINIFSLLGTPKFKNNSSTLFCKISNEIQSFSATESYTTSKLHIPPSFDSKYTLHLDHCNFSNSNENYLKDTQNLENGNTRKISLEGCTETCKVPFTIHSQFSTLTFI